MHRNIDNWHALIIIWQFSMWTYPYDDLLSLSSSLGFGVSESQPTITIEGIGSPLTAFPGGWEQSKKETEVEQGIGEGKLRAK